MHLGIAYGQRPVNLQLSAVEAPIPAESHRLERLLDQRPTLIRCVGKAELNDRRFQVVVYMIERIVHPTGIVEDHLLRAQMRPILRTERVSNLF